MWWRRRANDPVPSGPYFAAATAGHRRAGQPANQTFTVAYTDGTTSTVTQSFSDWYTPQNYPGRNRAVTTPYRNTRRRHRQPDFDVYGYND